MIDPRRFAPPRRLERFASPPVFIVAGRDVFFRPPTPILDRDALRFAALRFAPVERLPTIVQPIGEASSFIQAPVRPLFAIDRPVRFVLPEILLLLPRAMCIDSFRGAV
jgi:hypothetical protein